MQIRCSLRRSRHRPAGAFGTTPLRKPIVDVFINAFNRKVVAQDRRVVLSQQPKSSAGSTGEVLVREDAAVRHCRSLMQAFVDVAAGPVDAPSRFQRDATAHETQ